MLGKSIWREIPLISLCELTNGYAFNPSDWANTGKPIIRIQNLNGGKDFNYFKGFLSERYTVKTGTLLFAWSGNRGTSFGPFIWNGQTGLLNQHIFKVIPKEEVNGNWFYYALDEVRQRVERNAHGAIGLVHVRKQDLEKYKLIVPMDGREQNSIATILDTLDNTIQQTQALIAKLKQVKAGMLHDLLTRGLDGNGELRDPLRHPEQFKESAVGRIPKEWILNSLDYLIQGLETGVSVNAWNKPISSGDIGILKTSCVNSGSFFPKENKTVLPRDKDRVACPVRNNSIIIYMKHHSPEIHISTSAMSFSSFLSEFILHCLVCIKTSFLLRLN